MIGRPPPVIFDLDGTLVDSAPAIRDVGNALMAEMGLAPLDLAETHAFIGNGAATFVARALDAREAAQTPAERAAATARFHTFYAAQSGAESPPYPHVDAALSALRAAGYRLGLCTNKPEAPTRAVLAARGWEGLFEAVIAGDTLPVAKPDPRPLRAAAAQLSGDEPGVTPLFVGDSEVDAATAVAARAPFLLHLNGYRNAPPGALRHVAAFDDFARLPDLVHRIVAAAA